MDLRCCIHNVTCMVSWSACRYFHTQISINDLSTYLAVANTDDGVQHTALFNII